jgi:hypothetical protein
MAIKPACTSLAPCIPPSGDDIVPSLEEKLQREVCVIDLSQEKKFDFLEPNEVPFYEALAVHGLMVTTGTERSFFSLLQQSDPMQCEGIVVRDIEPCVKAYMDFKTLLLRVSHDRQDFCELDASPDKLSEIRSRVNQCTTLPMWLKIYYLEHLDEFGKIYYQTQRQWIHNRRFEKVNYYHDDRLFKILQQAIILGKFVSTQGDINDLSFLHSYHISVIDTSNIWMYSFINIKGIDDSQIPPPLIISTLDFAVDRSTTFRSYLHPNLSSEEKRRLNQLLDILLEANSDMIDRIAFKTIFGPGSYVYDVLDDKDPASKQNFYFSLINRLNLTSEDAFIVTQQSRESIAFLDEYIKQNCFMIPGFGYFDLKSNPKKFDLLTPENFQKVIQSREILPHVPALVQMIPSECSSSFKTSSSRNPCLSLQTYCNFANAHIAGWQENFEKLDKDTKLAFYDMLDDYDLLNLIQPEEQTFKIEQLVSDISTYSTMTMRDITSKLAKQMHVRKLDRIRLVYNGRELPDIYSIADEPLSRFIEFSASVQCIRTPNPKKSSMDMGRQTQAIIGALPI